MHETAFRRETTDLLMLASRANQSIFFNPVSVKGVVDVDLVTLIGDGANGPAGNIIFGTTDTDAGESHLIFFAEALGTFGTGYLLPLLQ